MGFEEYVCVTFQNVHTALQFERQCKHLNTSLRLIPVPRRISATCGMAAKMTLKEWQQLQSSNDFRILEFEKVYLIQEEKISEIF